MSQYSFSYSPLPVRLSLWNPACLARSSIPEADAPMDDSETSFLTGDPHSGHARTGGSDIRRSSRKPVRQYAQEASAEQGSYSYCGMARRIGQSAGKATQRLPDIPKSARKPLVTLRSHQDHPVHNGSPGGSPSHRKDQELLLLWEGEGPPEPQENRLILAGP